VPEEDKCQSQKTFSTKNHPAAPAACTSNGIFLHFLPRAGFKYCMADSISLCLSHDWAVLRLIVLAAARRKRCAELVEKTPLELGGFRGAMPDRQ
jgi:hypothetical protein